MITVIGLYNKLNVILQYATQPTVNSHWKLQ